MLDLELQTNSLFKMESNSNNNSLKFSHSVKNRIKSTSGRKQKELSLPSLPYLELATSTRVL